VKLCNADYDPEFLTIPFLDSLIPILQESETPRSLPYKILFEFLKAKAPYVGYHVTEVVDILSGLVVLEKNFENSEDILNSLIAIENSEETHVVFREIATWVVLLNSNESKYVPEIEKIYRIFQTSMMESYVSGVISNIMKNFKSFWNDLLFDHWYNWLSSLPPNRTGLGFFTKFRL